MLLFAHEPRTVAGKDGKPSAGWIKRAASVTGGRPHFQALIVSRLHGGADGLAPDDARGGGRAGTPHPG